MILFLAVMLLNVVSIDNQEKIYEDALVRHIELKKKDTIYFIKNECVNIPSQITKAKFIPIKDAIDQLDSSRSYYCLKLLPLKLVDKFIKIEIVNFTAKRQHDKINIINHGSISYKYTYNSKSNKYIYVSKETHGL